MVLKILFTKFAKIPFFPARSNRRNTKIDREKVPENKSLSEHTFVFACKHNPCCTNTFWVCIDADTKSHSHVVTTAVDYLFTNRIPRNQNGIDHVKLKQLHRNLSIYIDIFECSIIFTVRLAQ